MQVLRTPFAFPSTTKRTTTSLDSLAVSHLTWWSLTKPKPLRQRRRCDGPTVTVGAIGLYQGSKSNYVSVDTFRVLRVDRGTWVALSRRAERSNTRSAPQAPLPGLDSESLAATSCAERFQVLA